MSTKEDGGSFDNKASFIPTTAKRNYFNHYGGYRTTLCGSIDTAKWRLYLTKMELYLLMMWLFQPLLCYFNQSSNFISANTLVASVATYTDKLASVFRTWVSAVHREYH